MRLNQVIGPGAYQARCIITLTLLLLLAGCQGNSWNSPYPASESEANTLYSSFSERPKHLDPARSYAANEYAFIGQIYEPPLQYHFLKRPYQLVPLAASEVPKPLYFDSEGNRLPDGAPAQSVATSEYRVRIRPGLRYQPHPALAKDTDGNHLYHDLDAADIEQINVLADFLETGSREATAEDFVYQIKRMAFSPLHSPIAPIMANYIIGFSELSQQLDQAYSKLKEQSAEKRPYIDLRRFEMEGVTVEGRYQFRIRLHGKYPQFAYWLAMSFFAPMPWEADRFYNQPGLAERNINLNW